MSWELVVFGCAFAWTWFEAGGWVQRWQLRKAGRTYRQGFLDGREAAVREISSW